MSEHKTSRGNIALLHAGILEAVDLAHETGKASWKNLLK